MDSVESTALPRLAQEPPADGWPKLPVTREWGRLVRKTRRAAHWSQDVLARAVGITQGMLSQIENGPTVESTAVWPLCLALDIDPPHQFYRGELERRWVEAERLRVCC